ncbi:putative enoyl-CoA hydratase echA8 [Aliiroseovarius sp. xm-m-379]|uniref:crotonase/enoyl-CoA hydratase family protein n=1 Tax=unclassified Aliiroseovarius TaxID=2623558 RepID=UPI001568CD2F|nr:MULTISPECIES: crotonase/enoyl-CoA hydratase family protein [unclassified Aliiroseovarius]NRP12317.1 putative enoyl-CoA hydratase echA8 [Aliiroseovarius sp. xm-d-517]NRP24691.1 putative enoyl-CoA hydratase echA8 [Aliiroseovarius sp. xm-m-379]NRP30675.1 putative enoyl-CoA hydratase echA8 [Aliiroseovarius sp. xm-m-314]NRP33490.1 putative enoyl-CoA hydratase echA8 [Aliiroseovarius sp. xm-a-104]NRP40597.1 putative enoyl-CoA hydratase echA8 [Aliiroseovarius sp. xm-m-339-2]
MSYQTISISTDERGVATLLLDRADKHNAMSAQMIEELTDAAQKLGADDHVRVVILTGDGKSFCAGGDLRWMQGQMAADPVTRGVEAKKLAMMLNALNIMPKPLIAKVQGQAFGGGVGMASVSDISIGVKGAKFGLTETRLGLIPATIGPYVLARLGEAMARRVFMSARIFDADEAVTLGLLAKAVAPEDLDAAVEAEVAPYLNCAPGAVADAKALARRLGPPITEEIIDETIAGLVSRWESTEAQEGIAAFFAKEKPSWQS